MYLVNSMCLSSGDIVDGRYKIIDKLGQGGFGITYKADDNQQSPPLTVVLKQIEIIQSDSNEGERDTNYLTRLDLEANISRNLEHNCIPKFYNSFAADNCYYIVQEYIAGKDLSQEIFPGEPIEEEEALIMLREILDILQFVHSKNIIHRDIKPANIIRRHSDQKLYLIDFGAVKEIATDRTNASGIHLTRAIVSWGYTPPEQLAGHPRFNSDIFALGMMLMQAVTGFSINAICNSERTPKRDTDGNYIWQNNAPEISVGLKEIISKMIRYDFRDRYQHVGEILSDLNQILRVESTINSPRVPHNLLNKTPSQTTIVRPFILRQWQKIKLMIAAVAISLSSVILFKTSCFYSSNCTYKLEDNISSGEEILDPLSKGYIRFVAAQKYKQKKFLKSLNYYQSSWSKERRDAESLIYLNNALLEASKADYYTIAVAVPLSSDQKTTGVNNSSLAQNFLRGVAQAQTEINLSLINPDNPIFDQLPGQGILKPKQISRQSRKGLKVIIIDDGNNIKISQQAAKNIVKTHDLLGILGHYASEMTLATIDIYQKSHLAQVSFGTTTKELSTNYQDNFFRTVYTNDEEADVIVEYIHSINSQDKKVASFYNPNSPFSNHFWIEIKDRLKQRNIEIVKAFNIADENFNTQTALREADAKKANIYILLPDGQVTNSFSNAIKVIKEDNGESFIVGGNSIVRPKVEQTLTTKTPKITASVFWHPLVAQNTEFLRHSQQLWQANIKNGTAVAYDASLALIEAIRLQNKPSRKGTIAQLSNPKFKVTDGATGSIKFNTPNNGDRLEFYPTLVRLYACADDFNKFLPLPLEDGSTSNLACKEP
ncbi:MAG: bifunctional serine/threonine-protein kinase/ABC transporter substrate-binding protein [Cyanobacteria bacterium P01_G01_bin.67]